MGNNHSTWFDASKRKVLIMNFEDYYHEKISKLISKIDIKVNDAVGFTSDQIYYKNLALKLWYLTNKNRHLWKHHYVGTQGIIFVFSFHEKQEENLIYEAMTVFCDDNINEIPILVVIDSNNKDDFIVERLRSEMNKSQNISTNIKFQYVDFEKQPGELQTGFDWLCETMKPL